MLVDKALALSAWFERHNRLFNIIGWVCFAVICANYARFIKLPTIVAVPLWAAVVASFLRWGVWEGMLKPKVETAMIERAKAERAQAGNGLPPPTDG